MIENEDIEIDKETGEILIKGKTKWPGPYTYYFKENDD